MRTVGIIQARMQSTRLPGKVLKPMAGTPLLQVLIERVRLARSLDDFVVATGDVPANAPIVRLAQALGVRWFVGSELDVLGRFIAAAAQARADVVVRITADNPLTEPAVIDALVAERASRGADLALAHGLIDGAGAEVTTAEALQRARQVSSTPAHREHVTIVMKEREDLFAIARWEPPVVMRRPDLSVTIDTAEEFERVRSLYEALHDDAPRLSWASAIAWLDAQARAQTRSRTV